MQGRESPGQVSEAPQPPVTLFSVMPCSYSLTPFFSRASPVVAEFELDDGALLKHSYVQTEAAAAFHTKATLVNQVCIFWGWGVRCSAGELFYTVTEFGAPPSCPAGAGPPAAQQ